MADVPREPSEVERQTFAEHFRDVLRDEHGVALACPACGGDEWRAFGDVALPVLQGRKATGKIEGIPGSVHILAASCGKCGFVSLYDRDVVGG